MVSPKGIKLNNLVELKNLFSYFLRFPQFIWCFLLFPQEFSVFQSCLRLVHLYFLFIEMVYKLLPVVTFVALIKWLQTGRQIANLSFIASENYTLTNISFL